MGTIDNIVYKVTNKVNGKIYIGQTFQTLAERRSDHECNARKKVKGKEHNGMPITQALAKYGKDNFEWEILAKDLTPKEADRIEIDEIKKNSENKYNVTSGGKEHYSHSEETKAKIRAKAQAQWQDPEYVAKFKAGTEATKETTLVAVRASSAKISETTKLALANPEVKERSSEAQKKRWSSEEARDIQAANTKASWEDPEVRQNRIDKIREAFGSDNNK
jgi:group I intron endonuclease